MQLVVKCRGREGILRISEVRTGALSEGLVPLLGALKDRVVVGLVLVYVPLVLDLKEKQCRLGQ